MKNKNVLITFVLMVVVASLYRIMPREPNFAPHIAMALFGGAVIRNKLWAFALPVFSMFLSDVLYEVLYQNQLTDIAGFYEGQWQIYLLFFALTAIGFLIKKITVLNVLAAAIVAPTIHFIVSNFVVWSGWQGTRGLNRPRTFEGLMMCYTDAIPFYLNSLLACCVFSAILFGGYVLLKKKEPAVAFAS